MKSKVYSYLIIVVMLVVAVWLTTRNRDGQAGNTKVPAGMRERSGSKVKGFNRKVSSLEYTSHARCRMQCRRITQVEVQDIMKNGNINYRKSDVKDRPCPTYALEGYTRQDNQHVRIVFAQCDQATKVVTCIDLDKDFACNCN